MDELKEYREVVFGKPKPSVDLEYLQSIKSRLEEMASMTSAKLKNSVYQDYSLFLYSAKEISSLNNEMYKLKNLMIEQQAALNQLLNISTTFQVSPINRPVSTPCNEVGIIDEDEAETLPAWLLEAPEELEVFIAQRNFPEAVNLTLKVIEHIKGSEGFMETDLKFEIDRRTQELIEAICGELQPAPDRFLQEGPRPKRTSTSLRLLIKLKKASLATRLFLDQRSAFLEFVLDKHRLDATTSKEKLIQFFFKNVFETCNEFKDVFGLEQEKPFYACLFTWTTYEMEKFLRRIPSTTVSNIGYRYLQNYIKEHNEMENDMRRFLEDTITEEDEEQEWNISNDLLYSRPDGLEVNCRVLPGANNDEIADSANYKENRPVLKHSRLALELYKPYYATYISEHKLLQHHRPRLRKLSQGDIADTQQHGVKCLERYRKKCFLNLRRRILNCIKNGATREDLIRNYYLLVSPKSLDPKKGDIMLFEYSEQYPALLSGVGMASFLKEYIGQEKCKNPPPRGLPMKKKTIQQSGPFRVQVPQDATKTQQPFLTPLKPGQKVSVIENNLFRAPVFSHKMTPSDFIVLRSRNSYYLTIVDTIYLVGQQLPLTEVPAPGSGLAKRIDKDLFDAFVLRNFKKFGDRGIPKSVLTKAFPSLTTKNLNRRMEKISTIKEVKSYYHDDHEIRFVLKRDDIGLTDESEIRRLLTPEMYCLRHSMLEGLQRLKESGYGNSRLVPNDESPDGVQGLEDEVKAAPWNTTRAAVAAHNDKFFLDLSSHSIDPTGPAREGYSYVKLTKLCATGPQKSLTPDLGGFRPEPTIQSTPKSKPKKLKQPPQTNTPADRIKQKKSQTIRERLEQLTTYRNECQRIFDTQLNILASDEIISSDESGIDDEDSINQMTTDLNRMINHGKSVDEINFEKEEAERLDLLVSLNDTVRSGSCQRPEPSGLENGRYAERTTSDETRGAGELVLTIYRTFEFDGNEYERTETVRDQAVIKKYLEEKKNDTQAANGHQSLLSKSISSSPILPSRQSPVEANPTSPLMNVSGEQQHLAHSQAYSTMELDSAYPVIMPDEGRSRKLDTFTGVFTPVCLSMFSAILFLRLGYILGNAGLLETLAQLLLAYIILVFTILSVSAISTNGAIEGGGIYFMSSRVLGPEFGGSIGTLFYVANVVSSGLYLSGCVEGLVNNFGPSGSVASFLPASGYFPLIYASILNLFNLFVCLVGAAMFARTTLVMFAIVMCVTFSVMLSLMFEPDQMISVPKENTYIIKHNVTSLHFTGLSWNTLKSNMDSSFGIDYTTEQQTSFATIFGVCFTGVTGVLAGANISGDLKNPSKAIPLGTISGMIGAMSMMFVIHTLYSSIVVTSWLLLMIAIHVLSPPVRWGDITQALIFHQVRKYLLLLDLRKEHVKFWRPRILLMVSNPRSCIPLIGFVNDIKKSGLFVIGHVKIGSIDDYKVDPIDELYHMWLKWLDCFELKAFIEITLASNVREGMHHMARIAGLGAMKLNTIMFGFYDDVPPVDFFEDDPKYSQVKEFYESGGDFFHPIRSNERLSRTEYVAMIIDSCLKLRKNVCIGCHFQYLDKNKIVSGTDNYYLDIWPVNFFNPRYQSVDNSAFLLMQLACILNMVSGWKRSTSIRIFICGTRSNQQHLLTQWQKMSQDLRIEASINIVVWDDILRTLDDGLEETECPKATSSSIVTEDYKLSLTYLNSINNLIKEHSHRTAVTFLYLPTPPTEVEHHDKYLRDLETMTNGFPPTLLVHGDGQVISTTI
ncbi:Solute carrier family 12 member 9 [Fragariocoptes setiger]|uniref:Solute carrier family 12 member 9 n=1 Tax=Fragariocoptes setiger TaxID=1670756 RepID=A0ABQ7S5R0_9ACAR|nr:Solute carrier family 12 member 9 [Fragariocoptes setiger]